MSTELGKQIEEIEPEKRNVPLDGLYLQENLLEKADKVRTNFSRPLVIANYITDINDVIATRDEKGNFEVVRNLKNEDDWNRFQELQAQADVIITGKDYLKRFEVKGNEAENVLTQLEKGGEFESLGDWRLKNGYQKRSPDISIVSRSLDFTIPENVLSADRKILVFTTKDMADSSVASQMIKQGVDVIGSGKEGVSGVDITDAFKEKNYRVVKMTTGPRVLKILLDAQVLDILYITQVQKEIKSNPEDIQKVLIGGGKISDLPDFELVRRYVEKGVKTETGETVDQHFLVYYSKKLQEIM